MFSWQHTWHRQGFAALFERLVEPAFHWDSKIECYVFLAVLCLTTILAIELQRRLQQRLRVWDIVIPAVLLSPKQYESLLVTPNFAQGAFPFLFLVLIGFAWLQNDTRMRYALLLTVGFFATYSRFGVFVGVLLPFFLAMDYFSDKRVNRATHKAAYALIAITISLLTLGLYFSDYRINADIECFTPHLISPAAYTDFVMLMFANYFGLRHATDAAALCGIAILAVLGFVCVRLLINLRRQYAPSEQTKRAAAIVPLFFISLTLVVCLNTAYGRACGGLGLAQAARYTTYIEPSMLGFYIYLSTPGNFVKKWSLAAAGAVVIGINLPQDRLAMKYYHDGKERWKSCYVSNNSIDYCNVTSQFEIFTHSPERAHLKEKLLFLEQERLNVFRNTNRRTEDK